jgi:hypothetical protein
VYDIIDETMIEERDRYRLHLRLEPISEWQWMLVTACAWWN